MDGSDELEDADGEEAEWSFRMMMLPQYLKEVNMEKIVAVWSVYQTIKPTHAAPLGILGKFPVIRQNKQSHMKGLCETCPEEHQIIYRDCLLDKFLMIERARQDKSYSKFKPW